MKSLLITLEYPPFKGGVGAYLSALADQFNPKDIIVLAKSAKNSFIFDQKQSYMIKRGKLLSGLWPKWKQTVDEAKQLIQSENIDHVIISHILPMGYVALLLKKPFTVILHGMDIRLATSTPIKSFFAKQILKSAECIVVNSNFTKGEVEKLGISTKIIIAHPCPSTSRVPIKMCESFLSQKIEEYNLNNFNILSVNRLVARKGNDITIKAVKQLIDNGMTDISYTIIGNGDYKDRLNKLIVQNNLQDYVRIVSGVSDEELQTWYQIADVFCMPSRVEKQYDVEGFGIVYLEAAMYGRPSIAGNNGGMPEAVLDGETGYLVDSTDELDIADALYALYTDNDKRIEMGLNAQKRVSHEFTWEKQFKEYITFLKTYES